MGHKATLPLLLILLLTRQASSQASSGHAQKAGEDKDPIAIVELGAATDWNFSGGAATFAPNLAAEVTPIENWLELEAGVSPFYTHKSTEWDTDLLFKKLWTISRKAEFMLEPFSPLWTCSGRSAAGFFLRCQLAGISARWRTNNQGYEERSQRDPYRSRRDARGI